MEEQEEKGGIKVTRRELLTFGGGFATGLAVGASAMRFVAKPAAPAVPTGLGDIMAQRGLTAADASAALKTYLPGGKYDEFIMFSSGGHSGQVLVIGVPSMKLLKVVAAFTPEPWQGFGYGDVHSREILEKGSNGVRLLTWADTHHPEISRTNAEYDGQWLFINDKANARVAVIDLRDFKTKQIVKVPNMQSNHGGPFGTPNTEYIAIASQMPAPWGPEGYTPGKTYVPFNEDSFSRNFRGAFAFLAFDRAKGRIDLGKSFEIELPPYFQDLVAVGWGKSDGWAFCNSWNTELSTGGVLEGKPPLESGASQHNFDYLHILNWKKAEEVVKAGKYKLLNGIKVIALDDAVKEGILYFAPVRKSPHGCDISPGGEYIITAGKLDPLALVYSIDKIMKAVNEKNFEGKDKYGVPILKYDAVVEATVELGLGPLHTEFDNKGNAYTSLFIANEVVKWSLGPPYNPPDKAWKVLDRVRIHYNIGHLCTPESNTAKPVGKYVVALNKWSVDRFQLVGPLHPQNFQLIDVSGEKMQLLYDMPIPLGEPHYTKMIRADKLKPLEIYPMGTDALTMSKHPQAVEKGMAKAERKTVGGKPVTEVWATLVRSTVTPDIIRAKQGDKIIIHLSNIENLRDATHDFCITEYNVQVSVKAGEVVTVEFEADKPGVYSYYCTEFCSPLHLEMLGWLAIEPA